MGNQVVTELVAHNTLTPGLTSGERAIRGFAARVTGVMRGVGGALAGFFAARAIAGFVSSSVTAFGEAEKAGAKLAAVIKTTGGVVGFTAKQLEEYASQLQSVTTYEDDVITNTMAMLATFKNVRGDVFLEATEAILDMSAAMDTDAKSGAIQLGKALNDPIAGISALSRVGVQFTEQQKKLIETLVKSGKVVEAQKIILAELKSEFGGVAREMAGTFQGKMQQTINAWGDFKEAVGEVVSILSVGFLPALQGIVAGLQGLRPELVAIAESTRDWSADLIALQGDLSDTADDVSDFGSVMIRTAVAVQMVWERTYGNLALIAKSFGEDLGSTANYLELLFTKGKVAADMYATMVDRFRKRPKLFGADDQGDEFERRVKAIEDRAKKIREEQGEAGRPTSGGYQPGGPDSESDSDTPAKAAGDSKVRSGRESLEALSKRIESAAANPQVKATKEVKAAVDKAADKIVAAVEGKGDKGGQVGRIQQRRADEERRRQQTKEERNRGEEEGLVAEGGHLQRMEDNEMRKRDAAAARLRRNEENKKRVAEQKAVDDEKRRERAIQAALVGRVPPHEQQREGAIQDILTGRGLQGVGVPTAIGSGVRPPPNPLAVIDRLNEIAEFKLLQATRNMKGGGVQKDVEELRKVSSKLDKLVEVGEKTNQKLQTLSVQIPQLGTLTY